MLLSAAYLWASVLLTKHLVMGVCPMPVMFSASGYKDASPTLMVPCTNDMTMQQFRANIETAFGYQSGYLGPDVLDASVECALSAKVTNELDETSLLTECLYVLVLQSAYFTAKSPQLSAVDSFKIGQQPQQRMCLSPNICLVCHAP